MSHSNPDIVAEPLSASLRQVLRERISADFAEELDEFHRHSWQHLRHGDAGRWSESLARIRRLLSQAERRYPSIRDSGWSIRNGKVTVPAGQAEWSEENDLRKQLAETLRMLMPWRKGPFDLLDVFVDSEWRSDWKWTRLQNAIEPLQNRLVLDVGCGNGYYMWRMLRDAAAGVVGLDPTLLFGYQFLAVLAIVEAATHGRPEPPTTFVPTALHEAPLLQQGLFDTVFSMGVLYHRRSPLDHLQRLRCCLREGGQLVLESLVIDGGQQDCLLPVNRYAQMRNVWFIPSTALLERMLERMQFVDVRTIDVSPTTPAEQRSTDWMKFESLAEALNPADLDSTCEGYPAPRRAIILARRP